jgi:hypothetical protein
MDSEVRFSFIDIDFFLIEYIWFSKGTLTDSAARMVANLAYGRFKSTNTTRALSR